MVVTVSLAVPIPFDTEVAAIAQVGPDSTIGVIEQVRVTPDRSNPFEGVMLTLEVADEPDSTEVADNAATESVKPDITCITFDVLVLKSRSPL